MKKMLIFDLDGTLLNTIDDITDSLNASLILHGYKPHTPAKVASFLGHGAVMLVKQAIGLKMTDDLDSEKFEEIYNYYMDTYGKNRMNKTKEYDGVTKTLLNLKNKGYILGVLSNKPIKDCKPIIDHYFPNIFDFVYGTEKNGIRKPNPKMMDPVYKNYSITKDEIAYFGDSFVDGEFSTNCGFDYYLFLYGFGNKELLYTYKPKAFLNSFKELNNLF